MRKLRVIFLLPAFFLFTTPHPAPAQEEPGIQIDSLTPESHVEYDPATGLATATNGILVRHLQTVLTADRATVNDKTGEVVADGRVRIQQVDQVWVGEHIRYNFFTRQMETEIFRTGKPPVFAAGKKLRGDLTNEVYTAQSAFITPDDFSDPTLKLRAKTITIVPGKSISARNAVLYLGGVPVFYFPYYSRALGDRANNFNFVPGYRSHYGPFILGRYNWFAGENVDGIIHTDYREKRGAGGGPDVNLHLGRWGEVTLKSYYLHDEDPQADAPDGMHLPENRGRISFSYDATPFTNLNVKTVFRYQSDQQVLHDFFETEYRHNPQPDSFVEVNRYWNNFSLDVYALRRINNFFENVERLPDVRLTGYRQQLGDTPFYYESESSLAYLYHRYADTNPPPGLDYSAVRGDTYQQVTLPQTFFGWLNITPRAGARFTYYTDTWGPGDTNNTASRGVFNTGAEATFKVSRLWSAATNSLLEVNGLRHIIEPSLNYVFVPTPNQRPADLPQFDTELPSLGLLPIEYPDYNAIDSIDSQNVIRFGLRNRLQTKRDDRIENLLYWETRMDWLLDPNSGQGRYSDVFTDIMFRPRSWIALESQTRYDVVGQDWRMLVHSVTLSPNDRWSWSFGHWYLRDDLQPSPTALAEGNNILRSTAFFKLNENWAARASHYYDLRAGRLTEQGYTIYRDLRSWTAGVTVRLRQNDSGPEDFTFAFTFSLKAAPHFKPGSDAVRPTELLGY